MDAPRDRILDFAIDLREAITGKTAKARSVEDVNRLLVETFDSFVVWPPGSPLPDGTLTAGQVAVEPVLRPEIVESLTAGNPFAAWGTPPMEWVEAVWFSDHTQAYLWMNPNRRALEWRRPALRREPRAPRAPLPASRGGDRRPRGG